jgi:HEAT repeat protein
MADRQARSPTPPLAQNLLLSAATVILVGGAAEAISRLRERGRAAPPAVAEYITDWGGSEFVTLQSAASGWPPWEDYNSDGVRDREHAVEKPPGVRRVVCLGDSVTLGYGIRPHEAWPQVLEAEVGSDGGRLVVIVFPFRFQLRPGAPFPSAQREIARFCASEGIAFLDTLPALRPLGEDAFGDYDHFSPAGARRVAEAVADSGLLDLDDTANAERAPSPLAAAAGAPGKPLPALLASLHAADPRERAAAARALGEIGPPARSATPALVSRLDDEDESVRWRAGEALAAIGPEPSRCVEPLRRMAADPGRRGRAEAAAALGWIGPAAAPAVPALVSALADPRRDVRARSAWALGRIGPASAPAVPALIVMMRDPDNGWRAVDALGDIGPAAAAAEGALADALAQPSGSIRWRAAQALGRLGDAARAAGPALAHALEDRDDNVRLAAARALAQAGVGATVARTPLLGALSDTDSRVRAAAIRALHHLGPDPETAHALEERARTDPDETVRAAARHALKPGRS